MFLGSQIENKSLLKSISTLFNKGGNVFQLFLRKMNSSSVKDKINIPIEEQKEIKNFIKKNNIKGYVHASYLLNFCKIPVGLLRIQWAYNMLKEDMELAEKLGMNGVVLHVCSKKAVDEKWKTQLLSTNETIQRNIEHLDHFLKNDNTKIKLLLENSASDGYKIGGSMLELGRVFKPLYKKYGNKIGICIDTCHLFASGYPINTIEGMTYFFKDYKKKIGSFSTICLIHLNDSKEPLGSKKDRHEEVGKGFIFNKESLCFLISFANKHNISMCLETCSNYTKQIRFIQKCFNPHYLKGGVSCVSKNKIIKVLKEIQEYHKSLGNIIHSNQYSLAIYSLQYSNLTKICNSQELSDLKWIGKGILSKVDEYIQTGQVKILEEFKKDPIIIAHRNLTSVFGIGPKKAKELISQNIMNIEDLKKSNVSLTKFQQLGLKYYDDLLKKIPRKESEHIKIILENELKKIGLENIKVILAGSYYLGKKESGDIDIVLSTDLNLNGLLNKIINHLLNRGILIDSLSKLPTQYYMGLLNSNPVRHIDIHLIKNKDLLFHMLYFGSGECFSRIIRKKAKESGYKLNNKGLFNLNGKKINIKNEKNIFKKINL